MRVYQGLLLFLSLSSLIMISLGLIFKVFFFLRSGSWGGLHHPCCFSTSSPYSAPFGQVIACVPECLQGCLLWGRGGCWGSFCSIHTSVCVRILATHYQVHLFDGRQPKYTCKHTHTQSSPSFFSSCLACSYLSIYNITAWLILHMTLTADPHTQLLCLAFFNCCH